MPAGPGRMRLRVDVEMEHIALLAPGGTGGEFAAVGHFDRNGMVFGMNVLLHGFGSGLRPRACARRWNFNAISRFYTGPGGDRQAFVAIAQREAERHCLVRELAPEGRKGTIDERYE